VQWIAEVLPLTHFLRLVRGIVLKEAALTTMLNEIWPLAVFFVVMLTLATARFRKSLD
jgi:ABC-2 type transport system permease protein